MTTGILYILSLIYLSAVVILTFSINEIPVKSDFEKKEKFAKILKNTGRRMLKLIGGLILIGLIIEVLGRLN